MNILLDNNLREEFNLTADGNYDTVNKKLTNVGAPTSNADAATKKYVDENSGGGTSSNLTIDSNIDTKDTYRILNRKSPSDGDQPAAKQYAVINFFFRNGSHPMTGNVNMNNNKIENLPSRTAGDQPSTKSYTDTNFLNVDGTNKMTGDLQMDNNRKYNLPLPTGANQPTTLAFTNLKYLHLDGTVPMGGNLNMNNKKIINLLQPTDNTDAATKKYVDDTAVDVSNYLKRDGTSSMTGNLNMDNHKIVNLNDEPTTGTDVVNIKVTLILRWLLRMSNQVIPKTNLHF